MHYETHTWTTGDVQHSSTRLRFGRARRVRPGAGAGEPGYECPGEFDGSPGTIASRGHGVGPVVATYRRQAPRALPPGRRPAIEARSGKGGEPHI